jgi:hypothetical protein
MEGPNGAYKCSGYSTYKITSGMNSATLVAEGHKRIEFHDGHVVKMTLPGDYVYNIFMGTMGH